MKKSIIFAIFLSLYASIAGAASGMLNPGDIPATFSNGVCTTAKTINPANGINQDVTLTNAQNCVLSFVQPTTGAAYVNLKIIQSSTSAYNGTISTGGACYWTGLVPTIRNVNGAMDIISVSLDGTRASCQFFSQNTTLQ